MNGDLTAVKKFGYNVEEHRYTNTSTTSYYPSSTSSLFSSVVNYDKYSRVVSVANELSNAYDVSPSFNGSGVLEEIKNNGSALLATTTDSVANRVTRYEYNPNKTISKKTVTGTSYSTKITTDTYAYDSINRLTTHSCTYDTTNSKSVSGDITYVKQVTDSSADSRVYSYTYKVNGVRKAYTYCNYDAYKRITAKNMNFDPQTGTYFNRTYTYNKTRISALKDMLSGTSKGSNSYSYDEAGRIASDIYTGPNSSNYHKYMYDQYGRLICENNDSLDKTFVYSYNDSGNITSVKEYGFTLGMPSGTYTEKTFGYSTAYKDRLTTFDGKTITYNSMGYPISYNGQTFTWQKGRLTNISSSGPSTSCSFSRDGNNNRLSKVYTNGQIGTSSYYTYNTQYTYDGQGRLIREYCTETKSSGTTTHELVYLYDDSGIIGVNYSLNGATPSPYYYRKNLQGDVLAIYTANGTLQAEYAYDAYGNCTVTNSTNSNLAEYNPIRYRGYYYDRETGLYYLNSRYYNPQWRRFISPDDTGYIDPENINGLNLYAYCGNDPVNYVDPSGNSVILVSLLIGFGVGALISGGFEIAKQAYNGGEWNWNIASWDWAQIGLSALGGGIAGAISSISLGTGISGYISSFIFGGLGSVLGGLISGSVTSWESAGMAFLIGGTANVLGKGVADLINKGITSRATKALSSPIFDDMSLEDLIGSGINNNRNSIAYNKVLNEAANFILRANGKWTNSLLYSFISTSLSSIFSGWY